MSRVVPPIPMPKKPIKEIGENDEHFLKRKELYSKLVSQMFNRKTNRDSTDSSFWDIAGPAIINKIID